MSNKSVVIYHELQQDMAEKGKARDIRQPGVLVSGWVVGVVCGAGESI